MGTENQKYDQGNGLNEGSQIETLNVDDEDWIEIQDQAMSIVTLFLKPNVLKQV